MPKVSVYQADGTFAGGMVRTEEIFDRRHWQGDSRGGFQEFLVDFSNPNPVLARGATALKYPEWMLLLISPVPDLVGGHPSEPQHARDAASKARRLTPWMALRWFQSQHFPPPIDLVRDVGELDREARLLAGLSMDPALQVEMEPEYLAARDYRLAIRNMAALLNHSWSEIGDPKRLDRTLAEVASVAERYGQTIRDLPSKTACEQLVSRLIDLARDRESWSLIPKAAEAIWNEQEVNWEQLVETEAPVPAPEVIPNWTPEGLQARAYFTAIPQPAPLAADLKREIWGDGASGSCLGTRIGRRLGLEFSNGVFAVPKLTAGDQDEKSSPGKYPTIAGEGSMNPANAPKQPVAQAKAAASASPRRRKASTGPVVDDSTSLEDKDAMATGLVAQGKSLSEIADLLKVSRQSFYLPAREGRGPNRKDWPQLWSARDTLKAAHVARVERTPRHSSDARTKRELAAVTPDQCPRCKEIREPDQDECFCGDPWPTRK